MSLYYFDDPEEGLARETSHPLFIKCATADFYYDLVDEFSPFGNDSGAETLTDLEEWYRERRAGEKATTFLRKLITSWDFDVAYIDYITQEQLAKLDIQKQWLNDNIDQAVVATIFGQYKISGRCDKAMLPVAANAFRRQRYVAGLANELPESPWEHYDEYITRIATMEADLYAMTNKKAR